MAVRRKTENRLNLVRTCHTCGKTFPTTAASPWMRQLPNIDGKKQKICYFCSSACFAKSYKRISCYDGKAEQRRKEREAKRDTREKNKRYYETHKEQERARRKKNYWENHEEELAANAYYKKKRKLMEG